MRDNCAGCGKSNVPMANMEYCVDCDKAMDKVDNDKKTSDKKAPQMTQDARSQEGLIDDTKGFELDKSSGTLETSGEIGQLPALSELTPLNTEETGQGSDSISLAPPSVTPIQYNSDNRPSTDVIAQYAIANNISCRDALITLCALSVPLPHWTGGTLRGANKIYNTIVRDSKVIDASEASLSDQYVNLRESLYKAAQEHDVTAIKAWMELTAQERISEEVPQQLIDEAIAALKGMASEYAATLPSCCASAINELVDRICKCT